MTSAWPALIHSRSPLPRAARTPFTFQETSFIRVISCHFPPVANPNATRTVLHMARSVVVIPRLTRESPRPVNPSCFPPLPLGQPIPASPHAVSCSLPTMRSVRGYEEKDPEIVRYLTNGYPRFVVHPFAKQLAAHFIASTAGLSGRTLWLTSSAAMARALAGHLPAATGAQLFAAGGVHGVSHPLDTTTYPLAKTYLQNLGGFLSSREAEDHLVALKLKPAAHPEETFAGDAPAEIRGH